MMNNLMTRKKKYKFQVELRAEELQHVPLVNQELYVKVRLVEGGFTCHSQSLKVENHAVKWDAPFKFSAKMTANAATGELDTCICRVSVRQEVRGGKSFHKLGFADVNLAQFAGCGGSQCYLLEAYNSRHRLHNSTLRVSVDMVLTSGDICFKAQPIPRSIHIQPSEGPIEDNNKIIKGPSVSGSVPSLGCNTWENNKVQEKDVSESLEQNGHSRNSSSTSGSGYASNASQSDRSGGHARTASQGSGEIASVDGSLERPSSAGRIKPSTHSDTNKDPRVLSTREDPHDMINQIFQDTLGTPKTDEANESIGLRLTINHDGTASVSGHSPTSNKEFKPIIIKKR